MMGSVNMTVPMKPFLEWMSSLGREDVDNRGGKRTLLNRISVPGKKRVDEQEPYINVIKPVVGGSWIGSTIISSELAHPAANLPRDRRINLLPRRSTLSYHLARELSCIGGMKFDSARCLWLFRIEIFLVFAHFFRFVIA